LPIGGLKEKLLAALRGGIKTVFIPRENEKDLADMPKVITEGLEIIIVDSVDEVLVQALVKNPFKKNGPIIKEAAKAAPKGKAKAAPKAKVKPKPKKK